MWPDVRNLLAAGHSLKDIWTWLNEIGLEIGYARLSHYVSQLRLRDQAAQVQSAPRMVPQTAVAPYSMVRPVPQPTPAGGQSRDPLANVLEREKNRPGFQYNDVPDPKKLI